MFCNKCGAKNDGTMGFCVNCGNNLNNISGNAENSSQNDFSNQSINNNQNSFSNQSINNNQNSFSNQSINNNQNSFSNQSINSSQNNNIINDEELRKTFIGKNADKIINGKGGSIWMFLFGWSYLVYRKMYLYALIYIITSLILKLLFNPMISFILNLIFCFLFYKIYLNFVDRKINKIKSESKTLEEIRTKCRKKGGTSSGAVLVTLALYMIIYFVTGSYNVNNSLECNYTTDKEYFTLNNDFKIDYSGDDVKNISMLMTVNYNDDGIVYKNSYEEDFKQQYAETFKTIRELGGKAEISTNDNSTTISISADKKSASVLLESENYDYDTIKKQFEEQGYTCK